MRRSGDLSWVVLALIMVAFGSSYKHLSTVPLAIDGFGQMTSVTSPPGDPAETDNPPGISDDPGASQPTGFSPTAFPTTGAPAAPLDPIHDWQIDEDEMWVRQEKTSCLSPGEQPVSNDELLLSSHLDLIQQTSLGAAMMRDLQGFSTAICLDSDYELGSRTGGIYSQLYRAVIIRRSLTTLQRTQILAHELRHAWHDQQGFFRAGLTIEDALTLEFVREADADAFAMAVMWELHYRRGPAIWTQARDELLDAPLAVAFTLEMRNLEANPSARFHLMRNGMRSAYIAWFRDTDNDEFYVDRMAARYHSRPMIGSRRLVDVLPNLLEMGRLPGQPPGDTASYLTMFEINQAQRRSAENMPRFQQRVHGSRLAHNDVLGF